MVEKQLSVRLKTFRLPVGDYSRPFEAAF